MAMFAVRIVLQLGVNQYDNQLLNVEIFVLFFGGIVISTLEEYLMLAMTAAAGKPGLLAIKLYLSNTSQDFGLVELWAALEQQSLLLLMGIGVNWLLFCDRRRDWLLLQRPVQLQRFCLP